MDRARRVLERYPYTRCNAAPTTSGSREARERARASATPPGQAARPPRCTTPRASAGSSSATFRSEDARESARHRPRPSLGDDTRRQARSSASTTPRAVGAPRVVSATGNARHAPVTSAGFEGGKEAPTDARKVAPPATAANARTPRPRGRSRRERVSGTRRCRGDGGGFMTAVIGAHR